MIMTAFEADAKRMGRLEGRSEGFADGAYQKALETAKIMRMHNYPIAEVCEMTGLSKQEVEAIN